MELSDWLIILVPAILAAAGARWYTNREWKEKYEDLQTSYDNLLNARRDTR